MRTYSPVDRWLDVADRSLRTVWSRHHAQRPRPRPHAGAGLAEDDLDEEHLLASELRTVSGHARMGVGDDMVRELMEDDGFACRPSLAHRTRER